MTARDEPTLRDLGVALGVTAGVALVLAALLAWPPARSHPHPLAGAGSMHLDEPVPAAASTPR